MPSDRILSDWKQCKKLTLVSKLVFGKLSLNQEILQEIKTKYSSIFSAWQNYNSTWTLGILCNEPHFKRTWNIFPHSWNSNASMFTMLFLAQMKFIKSVGVKILKKLKRSTQWRLKTSRRHQRIGLTSSVFFIFKCHTRGQMRNICKIFCCQPTDRTCFLASLGH